MNSTKKIDSTRQQIAALQAQLADPINAQPSRAELRAALAAQVDAWHDHAAGRVREELQRLAVGADAHFFLTDNDFGVPIEQVPVVLSSQAEDTRAWLTYAIGKDAMVARFAPLLAEMSEGVDAETRAANVADIERRIAEAELRENDMILEAEAQGVIVDPRPGQRPHAAIVIGWGR